MSDKMEYVWYVSYGSNMLRKRFMHYIEGGRFENGGADLKACTDITPPLDVKTVNIPYDMYFGNRSRSWEGGGVSFLDTEKQGHALGVAYLVTREQFEHVAAEENGGIFPAGKGEWYSDIISIGEIDGYEIVTISNRNIREYNKPCEAYLETLRRGLRENYTDMDEEEIESYLQNCIK